MYYQRHLEDTIKKAADHFPVVLLSGLKQAGKTTLLKKAAEETNYITLEDYSLLESVKNKSDTFLLENAPPIIIDAIHHAPELFTQIKQMAEKENLLGLFYLAGSRQFQLQKNISEPLAGLMNIFSLAGLSLRELNSEAFCLPFAPSTGFFEERQESIKKMSPEAVWSHIHRGSLPKLHAEENIDWHKYYGDFFDDFLKKDVRDLCQVGDTQAFYEFMKFLARNTGKLFDIDTVSAALNIDAPKLEEWLSILVMSGLVYFLRPYFNEYSKKAIKTPKPYFTDTGLAAYLTQCDTPEILLQGDMAIPLFETLVISEVVKSYYNYGILEPPLFFYKDTDSLEIDLIIEHNKLLHPIVIRNEAAPNRNVFKILNQMEQISGLKRGQGGVICLHNKLAVLRGDDKIIPVWFI